MFGIMHESMDNEVRGTLKNKQMNDRNNKF